jgi:hypothetical protein
MRPKAAGELISVGKNIAIAKWSFEVQSNDILIYTSIRVTDFSRFSPNQKYLFIGKISPGRRSWLQKYEKIEFFKKKKKKKLFFELYNNLFTDLNISGMQLSQLTK